MAHGKNDYGATAQKNTVYSLQDMAELAARLGSIDTFDRSGDVVWLDDFEATTLKWAWDTGGIDGSGALSTVEARSGNQSALSISPSIAGAEGFFSRYFPTPVNSRIAGEISVNFTGLMRSIRIWLRPAQAGGFGLSYLSYNPQTETISILDDTNADKVVASAIPLATGATLFHQMKLVIDLSTQKYVRAVVDNHSIDLSAHAFYAAGGVVYTSLQVRLANASNTNTNRSTYFDDFILTQNEP